MVSCLSWVEMDGAMSGVSRLVFLPLPLPKTPLASSVPMGTCWPRAGWVFIGAAAAPNAGLEYSVSFLGGEQVE